jgi:hypothetical protein
METASRVPVGKAFLGVDDVDVLGSSLRQGSHFHDDFATADIFL